MIKNRLHVLSTDHSSQPNEIFISRNQTRQQELQAKFERLWLTNPEQFNPLRNCMQKERLERTWQLLTSHLSLQNAKVADIGCGAGVFSRRLRDQGAQVVAVDIAENALKILRKHNIQDIEAKLGAMPTTSLPDLTFDAVICTEVIAELPSQDYRIFFSELSRLIKKEGFVICSTPIDIYSDAGLERLLDLAQTELDIVDSISSYHALYIKIKRFFKIPAFYVKGKNDPAFRQQELTRRKRLSFWWFQVNTSVFINWFWLALSVIFRPILSVLENNRWLLLKLEKICQFLWDERGISHFIFIAKRRSLEMTSPSATPIEKPRKKEIWE